MRKQSDQRAIDSTKTIRTVLCQNGQNHTMKLICQASLYLFYAACKNHSLIDCDETCFHARTASKTRRVSMQRKQLSLMACTKKLGSTWRWPSSTQGFKKWRTFERVTTERFVFFVWICCCPVKSLEDDWFAETHEQRVNHGIWSVLLLEVCFSLQCRNMFPLCTIDFGIVSCKQGTACLRHSSWASSIWMTRNLSLACS